MQSFVDSSNGDTYRHAKGSFVAAMSVIENHTITGGATTERTRRNTYVYIGDKISKALSATCSKHGASTCFACVSEPTGQQEHAYG